MAEVIWRNEALSDLQGIKSFIGRDDPAAADRITRRLVEVGDSLADFPNRGRPADHGTREMVIVPPYVLSYSVEIGTVYILSIRHGRQRR